MGFFGPDYGKIGRDYERAATGATSGYVDEMKKHADSGAGATVQSQNPATASNFSGFDVLGDVSSYLDPSLQSQMKAATGELQNAYGAKGSLFSGAAGNAIGENARAMAERGWGDAFARATGARQQQFQNQMGIDAFNNSAADANFKNQFAVNNANFGNFNDIYGTELGSKMNIAGSKAGLAASEKSGFDYLMDASKLGTGAVAAFGGLG